MSGFIRPISPILVNKSGFKKKYMKVKNNEKYSIPIYENGVKTKWTIDGVVGDEKYFELLKYGNGKDLPDAVNVNKKK